jgi:hypothetical protein
VSLTRSASRPDDRAHVSGLIDRHQPILHRHGAVAALRAAVRATVPAGKVARACQFQRENIDFHGNSGDGHRYS